jgi:hypothetical protein
LPSDNPALKSDDILTIEIPVPEGNIQHSDNTDDLPSGDKTTTSTDSDEPLSNTEVIERKWAFDGVE